MNGGRRLMFDIKYLEQQFNIKTVKELKICGLWYCRDTDKEYNLNITEKIEKLGLIFVSLRTLLRTLLYSTLLYFAQENSQLSGQ